MADDDIYTIESDLPPVNQLDASLSSFRAYTGPQDGQDGVPLENLSYRNFDLYSTTEPMSTSTPVSTLKSNTSFFHTRPSSNRIMSIIAAFICFCPVGIAALVYSCQAQMAKREGKFAKAAYLGKSARDLAVASIVLGTSLLLIALFVAIIIFIPGIHEE